MATYEVTYISTNGYTRYTMLVQAKSRREAREEVEARTGCLAVRHLTCKISGHQE